MPTMLNLDKLNYVLQNPFLIYFWLVWATRRFFLWDCEKRKWNSNHFVAHTQCHKSVRWSHWCKSIPESATVLPFLGSSFSFYGFWARYVCVFNYITRIWLLYSTHSKSFRDNINCNKILLVSPDSSLFLISLT